MNNTYTKGVESLIIGVMKLFEWGRVKALRAGHPSQNPLLLRQKLYLLLLNFIGEPGNDDKNVQNVVSPLLFAIGITV